MFPGSIMTRLRGLACTLCLLLFPLTARAAVIPDASKSCCYLFGQPILPDPDLDMPVNPTIGQQIAAGQKRLARLRAADQTLDSDDALVAYFNDLVKKLLAAQELKPPYPIIVHVSTAPELDAYASVGGQIVIYSRIFDEADNEAQLVAVVGHELSHEIHNDYVFNVAKERGDWYGKNGLFEQSRAIERRADLDATRMMFAAGWDPEEQVKMMTRLAKRWLTQRDNHRVFLDPQRIKAVKKLISTLPAKRNLIKDSATFDELKKAL